MFRAKKQKELSLTRIKKIFSALTTIIIVC